MKKQKRKICIVTGTRAEYGHLSQLMRHIVLDPELELQIIATGMHLSPEFGLTYKQIEEDGFTISKKVDILLSSDTPVGIAKSMGLGLIGLAEAYAELSPDIIVILGDRFEALSAASAALVAGIPIAHISGGATTEGAFDEAIRHSLTKMSHLHFTSAEEYSRRVIQLGEAPERVFNCGELSIDVIMNAPLMSRAALEKSLGIKFKKRNLVITYHPVTLEPGSAKRHFENLLRALDKLKDTQLIFTKPNADNEGRSIIKLIDEYAAKNNSKAAAFVSLGQERYLSLLKHTDAAVGNSSSGITEAPSFKIGTINIGDRQKGRIRTPSIIDCEPTEASISAALKKLYSKEFQASLKKVKSPYGDGKTSEKILRVLKSAKLEGIIKKKFHDLPPQA